MRSTAWVVHCMWGYNFVLDTEVIKCQYILCRSTFEGVQVFNRKEIFVPFELESRSICDQSLEMGFVQKIVYLFFVHLQIRAIDSELLSASSTLLFDHFKQKSDWSRDYAFILPGLYLSHRLASFIDLVFVAFHWICFTTTCLAVCKDCWVVSLITSDWLVTWE